MDRYRLYNEVPPKKETTKSPEKKTRSPESKFDLMADDGDVPRFAVLKSCHIRNYVRHAILSSDPDGPSIRCTGIQAQSPECKFELEMAKIGKGLLNIRSCFNNKYWALQSPDSDYITAAVDKPEEDESQWSCTLFEPIPVKDDGGEEEDDDIGNYHAAAKRVQFRNVYSQKSVFIYGTKLESGGYDWCLQAQDYSKPDPRAWYSVIDWESLVVLPKHVAFKGDNGNYLTAFDVTGTPYLKFESTDIGDPRVANEIVYYPNGSIRIKSIYFNKFWRLSPNWIWADSEGEDQEDKDTMFEPVKVHENAIALRNLGNNSFCKRLTLDGKDDCLNANMSGITHDAILIIEEPVFLRKIYNVNFHLNNARIYGEKVITMVNREASNANSEKETVQLRLKYKQKTTSSWNSSVSVTVGVSTKIQSGIPSIAEGKIGISASVEASFGWGGVVESSSEIETTHLVTVPENTKVRIGLLATEGTCDIPFSYMQRDTLTNGREVISEKHDGIYTGVSTYNFKYETTKEALQ